MTTYLTQTKFNTYKYQRRVPKQLEDYIQVNSFRVSLGADIKEATATALHYNSVIDEAIQLISLNVPDETIVNKLSVLIPYDKLTSKSHEGLFLSVANDYIKSNKSNVRAKETQAKYYFYHIICPSVFKHIVGTANPQLKDITYKHLLKFSSIITKLPKLNIQKYRTMEVSNILKILNDIPIADRITEATISKHIKKLRSLFNFALIRGLVSVNLATAIPIQKTLDDKLQRLPLNGAEIKQLESLLDPHKKYLMKVLYLTGMRLSELYKCKLSEIEGVLCFDLSNRSIKLKTKSSYRVIPVHSSLLKDINNFEIYKHEIIDTNIARSITRLIKKNNFKDSHKKSLYSLRHSFATNLIKLGASNVIVSQLLGHSLAQSGGMTLTRYASGFSIKQLKDTIELLK